MEPLTSDDLVGYEFRSALRGYAVVEVDALLARLAGQLEDTDAELDELRSDLDVTRRRLGAAEQAEADARRELDVGRDHLAREREAALTALELRRREVDAQCDELLAAAEQQAGAVRERAEQQAGEQQQVLERDIAERRARAEQELAQRREAAEDELAAVREQAEQLWAAAQEAAGGEQQRASEDAARVRAAATQEASARREQAQRDAAAAREEAAAHLRAVEQRAEEREADARASAIAELAAAREHRAAIDARIRDLRAFGRRYQRVLEQQLTTYLDDLRAIEVDRYLPDVGVSDGAADAASGDAASADADDAAAQEARRLTVRVRDQQ